MASAFQQTSTWPTTIGACSTTGPGSGRPNYHAGGNGDKVLSTNFMSENHAVTLGYQNEGHLFTFRGAYQNIPYQGYPNQRMDMTRNRSYSLDALYKGAFEWGTLEARAYWHQVFHKMGFLEDRFWLNHPMIALGRDFGYSVKAEIPYSDQDLFRIGNEFHGYRLQDYWPSDPTGFTQGLATPPGTLSRPFANVNINGGQRNRFGTYVEWERRWTPQWSSLIGVRNDIVWMDTGPGQSYTPFIFSNSPLIARANNLAVNIFNAQNRARTDINFDMTALARYEPEPGSLYEFGYSRKTRSPNLYERYTWPVAGPFTAMFNWFGDGNGYTGNLNLKPEVAHNVAFTGAWRDMSGANNWEARISPFYTYVENYIDGARTGGTFNTFPVANSYIFQIMQFRNFNAELYGVDGSGRVKLHKSPEYGRLQAVERRQFRLWTKSRHRQSAVLSAGQRLVLCRVVLDQEGRRSVEPDAGQCAHCARAPDRRVEHGRRNATRRAQGSRVGEQGRVHDPGICAAQSPRRL